MNRYSMQLINRETGVETQRIVEAESESEAVAVASDEANVVGRIVFLGAIKAEPAQKFSVTRKYVEKQRPKFAPGKALGAASFDFGIFAWLAIAGAAGMSFDTRDYLSAGILVGMFFVFAFTAWILGAAAQERSEGLRGVWGGRLGRWALWALPMLGVAYFGAHLIRTFTDKGR